MHMTSPVTSRSKEVTTEPIQPIVVIPPSILDAIINGMTVKVDGAAKVLGL